MNQNDIIDLIPLPDADDDTIITIKPPFNACFDNLRIIQKHVNQARNLLPDCLKNCDHIIANQGVDKIMSYFQRNGI